MKTVRFSVLVDRAGHPDTHLLLVKPEQDKALQKAIKADKVVTVFQNATGSRTDHGEVGFQPGAARQYLIFPRPVGKFAGHKVVGIKYELLESAPIPKSQQAKRPRPPERKQPSERKRLISQAKVDDPNPEIDLKVVKFPKPIALEVDEESEALEEIKTQIRRAMAELEKGRQVAAFNLLKRIVGD